MKNRLSWYLTKNLKVSTEEISINEITPMNVHPSQVKSKKNISYMQFISNEY